MNNLIWIASYPRSGNTWFRIFLYSLVQAKTSSHGLNLLETGLIANSRYMFDDLSGVSSSDLSVEEINTLRPVVYQLLSDETNEQVYLKTHERFFKNIEGNPLFPLENSFGCIYLIRNPLDVVVSNAYFFRRSIDETIEAMNDPLYTLNPSSIAFYPILEEQVGSWSEHVTSWINSGQRLHFIRYEDLKSQPFETFSKALNFLGLKFSNETIEKAIAASKIQKLQDLERLYGFKEKLQGSTAFFRNGEAGDWKNKLTKNQIAKIIQDHQKVMRLFGYLNENNSIVEF